MTRGSGFDPQHSALFTDLYQLTMLQGYYAEGLTREAVFELFYRERPAQRNFVMAAGLDEVLEYFENLRFTDAELDWLRNREQFSDTLLDALRNFRFTGDVYAMAEGTLVFENEPVVQVVAPLPEAQLVETYLLNQIHTQSLAATKAARVVLAAQGRTVVDFGSRRSQGTDAALKVARTSYIAGADGTSNVAAGRLYGVPIFGTMAHSYIEAHNDELAAFRVFSRQFPETTLLVDTYDTLGGVRKLIELADELGEEFKVRAIRLDSGDLGQLAKDSRRILDEAGLDDVIIFASGGLNESKIAGLLEDGAPIDGFGVGTDLAVSADAPYIDFSYKLVSYDGIPRMKLSSRKATLPGRKQVFRKTVKGRMVRDIIAQADETPGGEPLLRKVMESGRRLPAGKILLEDARERARLQLDALPRDLKVLDRVEKGFPVEISAALLAVAQRVRAELEEKTTR